MRYPCFSPWISWDRQHEIGRKWPPTHPRRGERTLPGRRTAVVFVDEFEHDKTWVCYIVIFIHSWYILIFVLLIYYLILSVSNKMSHFTIIFVWHVFWVKKKQLLPGSKSILLVFAACHNPCKYAGGWWIWLGVVRERRAVGIGIRPNFEDFWVWFNLVFRWFIFITGCFHHWPKVLALIRLKHWVTS